MEEKKIQAYYGDGRGKTSAAIGYAINRAGKGDTIILIQFLKRKNDETAAFMKQLEPQIQFFRFQKSETYYDALTPTEKQEENMYMKNGFQYARKVLSTGQCDLLILDEILGLMDLGVVTVEDVENLLKARSPETEIILTGQKMDARLMDYLDCAYEICVRKCGRTR